MRSTRRTGRGRGVRTVGVLGLVIALVALAAAGALTLRRDDGDDPADAAAAGARRFLDAWAAGELERAAGLTDDPEAAGSLLESVRANTRPQQLAFTLAGPAEEMQDAPVEGARAVPFTATFTLDGLGE